MLEHKRAPSKEGRKEGAPSKSVDTELWRLGEAFISDEEMDEADSSTRYAYETSKYFKTELFERLGSWELLSAVVSLLYRKLFQHPETRVFFECTDKTKLMKHMAGFLSCALTGHLTLSSYELWSIHRHMLWHPDGSDGPHYDGACTGCPMAGYLGSDGAGYPTADSQTGVSTSRCSAAEGQADAHGSRPLLQCKGITRGKGSQRGLQPDVLVGPDDQAAGPDNQAAGQDYQADARGSCPLPHHEGGPNNGWHAHQASNDISCPLFTAFQGGAGAAAAATAAEDGAAAAGNGGGAAAADGVAASAASATEDDTAAAGAAAKECAAAAAAVCSGSVDHPLAALNKGPTIATAQICTPAGLSCSGRASQSKDGHPGLGGDDDGNGGVGGGQLSCPSAGHARGTIRGSSSCSSINAGPQTHSQVDAPGSRGCKNGGGMGSCSPRSNWRSSALSTRRSMNAGDQGDQGGCSPHSARRSSTLSNGNSTLSTRPSGSISTGVSGLSSSASAGIGGFFSKASSCRDEEEASGAVGDEAVEGERNKSLQVLGPRHVGVMTMLLKDALVELEAKQELIDDMVRVISGASYLFERGDIFVDAQANDAKWQQGQGAQEKLRGPFSSDGLHTRSSLKSPESSFKLVKLHVSFASTMDCTEGASEQTSQAKADAEQEKTREDLRNLFASW